MPYVNIRITKDGVTKEQKRQLIQGVTKVLVDVLNKNPMTTHVIIDEVDPDNWGYNSEQTSEIRKRQQQQENEEAVLPRFI